MMRAYRALRRRAVHPKGGSRDRDWVDPAIALGLVVGYVALLLSTVHDLGYARDEGFYFQAARSYEGWFELLFTHPDQAFTRAAVDRYWSANHEHPALMKALFALSHRFLHEKWRLFAEAGTSYRFPGMLISALGVGVTYLWARRLASRLAALVGGVSLAMMPQVFHHAHLACFDMPVAAMWLITSYAYHRALETGGVRWPLASGVLYGLLLDTKHNAWLFPPVLVAHLFLTRSRPLFTGTLRGRIAVPSALLSVAIVGPLVFYACWPWIWYDTGRRIAEWIAFHTGHEYYNMEFLGRTYWKPPMPLGYAWVMTLATVPLTTLALSAIGFGHDLVGAVRARELRTRSAPVFWTVSIFVSYAPWLSTKTPIFGGTKHWLTAYPFLCLFAAVGFERVACAVREELQRRFGHQPLRTALVEIAAALCVVVAPVAIALGAHPWGLAAYTPLVGGASGAATLGLNRTFWGYTTGAVQDFLNQRAPPRAAVYVHDTAMQSWEMMQADGRLRSDLRGTMNIHDSDFALYHHEPHMGRVEYQIWVAYGTSTPAHIGTYDGVPVVWVYERPRPR